MAREQTGHLPSRSLQNDLMVSALSAVMQLANEFDGRSEFRVTQMPHRELRIAPVFASVLIGTICSMVGLEKYWRVWWNPIDGALRLDAKPAMVKNPVLSREWDYDHRN